ncbi:MAG: GGDEF domain-containing protein [Clostridiales bacterium]|mgnify:CR=1 FL=1|nr:GGDEF domain-containing protein [Clostridiales bacterium]
MDELHYQIDLLSAMNQKLGSNEKMYRAIFDTSMNAFLYYSFEEDRLEILGNWEHFFNVEITSLKDITRIYDLVEEKYIFPLRDAIFLEKTGKECVTQECRSADGKIWMECEVTVSYECGSIPSEKVIRFRDITKFKRQNDELSYLAYYDVLTGLYNRNYFIRILSDWIGQAKEENAVVSVLFADIDDFRKINDGMGMIVGDDLVQQVGQFLGELREDKVIVSHFNSDLYCIAIYNPCGTRSVEHIYHTIKERMKFPFVLAEGGELNISISVGVAEFPEAGNSAIELINCAEIVMFKAKNKGKARIQYFDAPILNEFLKNVEMENKLKNAIAEDSFVLYYQPQYDVKTGKMRGVEALVRWKDKSGKMISPAEFIPVAEKSGLIVPIGNWVLRKSISTFAGWKEKYDYDMILSINISAIQYKKQDFVSKLMSLLNEYGVESREIELEITESILIDDFEEITRKMHALREYGIRVSMDDFGTGYSSLSYLKGLPIDTLKIDKSFIDTLTTDEATKTITEAMISMVKKLGLETVAEGVETADQLAYLKSIDCDNIQGFLLGRPMPEAELENVIKNQI